MDFIFKINHDILHILFKLSIVADISQLHFSEYEHHIFWFIHDHIPTLIPLAPNKIGHFD
jgi:hypothetical protein